MPCYRVLNLANKEVKYIAADNKTQARAHVTRKTVQVELADPEQMSADAKDGISLAIEKASNE